MYCVDHQRSAHTITGKRKLEVLEEGARSKKAKFNPQLSPPSLPTPTGSSNVVRTTTSPSIVQSSCSNASSASDGSSSSDGLSSSYESSSCDPHILRLKGIQKAESVCGFSSRETSTSSSDSDSLKWESPSEPAPITTDKVTIVPSSSNSPFPSSRHALTSQNLTTLQTRLNSLLPALFTANQALEVDRAEGRLVNCNIENVSNAEGPYIEMDLHLGVLEEKHAEIRLSDESDSESSTGASSRLAEVGQGTQHQASPKKEKEKNVLGKLMGRSGKGSPKAKPKIEVLS